MGDGQGTDRRRPDARELSDRAPNGRAPNGRIPDGRGPEDPAPDDRASGVWPPADRGPDTFLIALAALDLLADAAHQQPLLVVVEDAHWVDPPSGAVLAFVARRV